MPWAISEATMASAVVVLSIRGALVLGLRQMCRSDWRCRGEGCFHFAAGQLIPPHNFWLVMPRESGASSTPSRCHFAAEFRLRVRWLLDRPLVKDDDNALMASANRAPIETGGLRPEDLDAPLSYPHLRRAARRAHRFHGSAVGMVPPHPRPWRVAVYRPARPLWLDPDRRRSRLAGLQDRREVARRMGRKGRRPGARASCRHE